MKSTFIITLFFVFAGCSLAPHPTASTLSSINTPPLTRLFDNVHSLNLSLDSVLAGRITAGEFTLADLHNAHDIYAARFATTGSLYDKADAGCMDQLIAYHPTLMALYGPAPATEQAAPVTGFFSGIAAGRAKIEDAEAAIAAKNAILHKGLPQELMVGCASWYMQFTGVRALSH